MENRDKSKSNPVYRMKTTTYILLWFVTVLLLLAFFSPVILLK